MAAAVSRSETSIVAVRYASANPRPDRRRWMASTRRRAAPPTRARKATGTSCWTTRTSCVNGDLASIAFGHGSVEGEVEKQRASSQVKVLPVTPSRWKDLVELFGWDRGAYSGCWCMFTKPVDEEPNVWSVVCWYMDRHHRGQGLGSQLLAAAVDHAKRKGARIIEGYPIDAASRAPTNAEAFPGLASMFRRAGFREVARRSRGRPVMRYRVT